MKIHKHRALRPLTYRTAFSKARRFAAMPGFREQAMLHKHHAIRLAHSDGERAKAEALVIPTYDSPFEAA